MTRWCGLLAVIALLVGAPVHAAPTTAAVFDVEFMNTSPEPTTAAETERVKHLGDQLRDALTKSGQYALVDLAPLKGKLAGTAELHSCSACAQGLAQEAGADLAVVTWVQKVSNLILNINTEIEDVATGKVVKAGSVDIRGNTDESWDRGLKFLLEEHVFGDRP